MKKKFSITLIFLIIISTFAFYNLAISSNCKKHSILKIVQSISDLGLNQLSQCYSKKIVLSNTKKILSSNETIYQIARKFRRNYIKSNFKYDNVFDNKSLEYVKEQIIKEQNLEKPFIKGVVDNNVNSFDKSLIKIENNKEFSSWSRSHGGYENTHYDSNDFINKKNVRNLKLKWVYTSINDKEMDKKWLQGIQSNPIFFDNKIIAVNPDWTIVALDPLKGNLIWKINTIHPPSGRGMVAEYDEKLNKNFLYIHIGSSLYKFDLKNGKKVKNFGSNGRINDFSKTAPMIYKDKLITGIASLNIFNKNSGKLLKKIKFHPKRNFQGGVSWGGVAMDKKRGIVYVTTGNPRPGSYGVNRPGSNENSCSIIAFDINNEKIKWSFQETAHDLWDYDIASPPIISDLVIGNKIYETVIAVTKVGNTLIFERNTGEPIYDITYKEAPKSKMSGEYASKYQIFLKKPERFSKIEFNPKDFNFISSDEKDKYQKKMKDIIYGWYEPPAFGKDLLLYGVHGGAQWPGAALDPINQDLYIPVNNDPWVIRPQILSREIKTSFPKNLKKIHSEYISLCSSCHGNRRNGKNKDYKEPDFKYIPGLVGIYKYPELNYKLSSIETVKAYHENLDISQKQLDDIKKLFRWWDNELDKKKEIKIEADAPAWSLLRNEDGNPPTNPPWGYIAKLNLVSGKIMWKSPIGSAEVAGEMKKVGTISFGGIAMNKAGVIFFNGTEDKKAYAIDSETGKEIWSYQMEGAGTAPPIIFNLDGKQYVSFVSTGGFYLNYKREKLKKSAKIYTFTVN